MKVITTIMLVVSASNYASAGIIDNFERDTVGSDWASQTQSTLSLSQSKAHGGQKSMLWTYTYGGTQYNNEVTMTFAPQDWSHATTITFYMSTGNMNGLTSANVRFVYYNSDGTSAAKYFVLTTSQTATGFVPVTVSLPATPNLYTSVNKIKFFVTGSDYSGAGIGSAYQFYIDDISVDTPVPEAASLTALGAPIGFVLLMRRHK